MASASIDYLRALRLKRATASVTLNGRSLSIPRACLGLHYELQEILVGIGFSRDSGDAIVRYVAMAAGLPEDDAAGASLQEISQAFSLLVELNRFQGTLPIIAAGATESEDAYSYPNRALASLVARLARAYGWTVDHILEGLGPEEAMCYLQEAVVMLHEEQEFAWNIAGLVDKDGKKITFPPLRFATPPPLPKSKRPPAPAVPEHMRPTGIVIAAR